MLQATSATLAIKAHLDVLFRKSIFLWIDNQNLTSEDFADCAPMPVVRREALRRPNKGA